jgi:hypothetical protein
VRGEVASADRAAEVRGAARAWRRAGVIGEAGLAAIEERFPDDRVRVGGVFRVLLFLFTLVAIGGAWGAVALVAGGGRFRELAPFDAAAGVALAALTELQLGPLRRRGGGTEAATSLGAIGLLLWAAGLALDRPGIATETEVLLLCLLGALLAGVAAWRWGYALYAGVAAAALLAALAHLPAGRLAWVVVGLAAAPALLGWSASERLPPAYRGSAAAVLLVALAGLYVAVHLGSWDAGFVEELGRFGAARPPSGAGWRWASALATAAVPVLLLAWGLRRRRLVLLAAGAGAAVASLVTLVHYFELRPAWLVTAAGGALAAGLALALWKLLDAAPGAERGGFTAAALGGDRRRQEVLEAGVAALVVPGPPHPSGAAGEPGFAGGGGRAGGAGATGEF